MSLKFLQQRLAQSREEHSAGQEQMRQLDQRRTELAETLNHIAGAIQILEEEVAREKAEE